MQTFTLHTTARQWRAASFGPLGEGQREGKTSLFKWRSDANFGKKGSIWPQNYFVLMQHQKEFLEQDRVTSPETYQDVPATSNAHLQVRFTKRALLEDQEHQQKVPRCPCHRLHHGVRVQGSLEQTGCDPDLTAGRQATCPQNNGEDEGTASTNRNTSSSILYKT